MQLQNALDASAFVLLRASSLAGVQLAVLSIGGVPITPATWAGSSRALRQDFHLHDLTVLLSGCSCGLAPEEVVTWL